MEDNNIPSNNLENLHQHSITCKTKIKPSSNMLFRFSQFSKEPLMLDDIVNNSTDEISEANNPSATTATTKEEEASVMQFIAEHNLPSPGTPTNQGIVSSSPPNIKQQRLEALEKRRKELAGNRVINPVRLQL